MCSQCCTETATLQFQDITHYSLPPQQPPVTNYLLVSVDRPLLDASYDASGCRHLGGCFQGSFMVQHVLIICSFLYLNNVAVYGYTTFYVSIYLFMIDLLLSSGYCEQFWCEYCILILGYTCDWFHFFQVENGVARSYDKSLFNFVKNCCTPHFPHTCIFAHFRNVGLHYHIPPHQHVALGFFVIIACLFNLRKKQRQTCYPHVHFPDARARISTQVSQAGGRGLTT